MDGRGAHGELVTFADDLALSLQRPDSFDERFREVVDRYIERAAIEAAPDDRVAVAYQPDALANPNLRDAGVSTIIRATGYDLDSDWIEAQILMREATVPSKKANVKNKRQYERPGRGRLPHRLLQHLDSARS